VRVDLVTLFPELFGPFLATSFVGRACERGALAVRLRSPREFGLGKHRSVDDTPYGGGSGMVMRVDCLVDCLESLDADAPGGERARRVLLTPQGAPFVQAKAVELARLPALALVCGRYEGFDERVRSFVDEEISLGDFVMTGGEVAAMAVVEAVVRLLPGVLGNAESVRHESHGEACGGMLEYPQYTRPVEYRGLGVPDVLKNGNHAAIERWRLEQSALRTAERRPDLVRGGAASKPAGGAAPNPAGGAASKPAGGAAPKPAGGAAPKPAGGGAQRLAGGTVQRLVDGVAEGPAGEGVRGPAGEGSRELAGGEGPGPEGVG
jgi:tRNA (guanine37-N1)-methyltransferase